jgi:hypothetical protein
MLNRYRINDEGKAMGRLKDRPAGTISPHYVARGAEAPELAALLVVG